MNIVLDQQETKHSFESKSANARCQLENRTTIWTDFTNEGQKLKRFNTSMQLPKLTKGYLEIVLF